ncbi:MAG: NPCBM/NEW2 domain-containing protein [Planctomycetaceae bacterium]
MKILILFLTLLDARVTLLSGSAVEGRIAAMSTEERTLQLAPSDGGAATSIALSDVVDVQFISAKPKHEAGEELLLHDESRIPCETIAASAAEVSAASPWLSELRLPRTSVRAIRMQPLHADWEPQWDALLARRNDKDLLVRAKRDGSGLDFIDGVVSSVTEQTVIFLLDGDEVPVPRERVFGVIFSRLNSDKAPLTGPLSVFSGEDALIKVREVKLSKESLEVVSSWGQTISFELPLVSRIDFSSSRFHFLSDLQPIEERYFGTQPADSKAVSVFPDDEATRTGPLQFWRMSKDAFPYGEGGRPPLMLRGRVYRKGLCIFPQARIAYALDGRYTNFVAQVGVDDEVAFNSPGPDHPYSVSLTIEGDGTKLWEGLIEAPAEAQALDVDVSGVRTLTLLVGFGDGRNYCDYLDLADAKLILATEQPQP